MVLTNSLNSITDHVVFLKTGTFTLGVLSQLEGKVIPTSYPGPSGQLGPRKTSSSSQVHLDAAGVAVAQPGGPLVILTTPAVCKLWRLIGTT